MATPVERTSGSRTGAQSTRRIEADQSSAPTKITVNLSPNTDRALKRLAEREGVTITEALRRLVGYGDFLYEATQVRGDELLVRGEGETQRIVVL